MLGNKGFEGIYTLIKSLEALPTEKQEEFLKSQKNTLEGEVVVIRKGDSFCLDVVKAQGGSFTPEVAKKADEDTIGDDGHVNNEGKPTKKKSEEPTLEKGEGGKEEAAEWAKDPEGEKEEHGKEMSREERRARRSERKAAKKAKKVELIKTIGLDAYKIHKAEKKEMKKSRKTMKSVSKFNKKFDKMEKSLQTQE